MSGEADTVAVRRMKHEKLGSLVAQEIVRWRVIASSFASDQTGADRIVEGFLIELFMRMSSMEPPYHVDDISKRFIAFLKRKFIDHPIHIGIKGPNGTHEDRAVSFGLFASFAIKYLEADDPEPFM